MTVLRFTMMDKDYKYVLLLLCDKVIFVLNLGIRFIYNRHIITFICNYNVITTYIFFCIKVIKLFFMCRSLVNVNITKRHYIVFRYQKLNKQTY